MLLWLMNLGFAGGTQFIPSSPPPPVSQSGDGVRKHENHLDDDYEAIHQMLNAFLICQD
jgi:hypothetical protein